MRLLPALLLSLLGLGSASAQPHPKPIVVGSKLDTEGRLLGELLAQLIEAHTDLKVERRLGLGGTMICFRALESGEIDLYPEYTGTGLVAILKVKERVNDPLRVFLEVQRRFREEHGLEWLEPFGFSNSYALAMPEAKAAELGVRRISDLAGHKETLRFGLTHEFLKRADGWPSLARAYGLEVKELRGVDHGLAYEGIRTGRLDVIDAYTTDGKLLRFKLRVLEDDRTFFPPYHAAPLVRREVLKRHPQLAKALETLAFQISYARMQRLNYMVEEEKRSFADAARAFLKDPGAFDAPAPAGAPADRAAPTRALEWGALLGLTGQHLKLTLIAVLLATLVSVPLGVWITRYPRLAQPVLGGTGVIQTIPSLALLAFMIPIPGLGLGATSAVVALFLYALLPIVRNTYTGIQEVDADLIEAARGMGLTDREVLTLVQLPLATRTIMAGIRTSTVISIGVATLAAFIGAGGLGEPIITGLQLNDTTMILSGAIPAAGLAVVVDLLLGLLERALAPRGVPTT